ncbi:MAG: hypothetical protein K5979_08450 [Ruminococcus sp.]|nr:hypothetical protein [Ruminococcus sp.]
MKTYDEMFQRVLARRDEYEKQKQQRKLILKKTTAIVSGAAAVLALGLFTNALKAPKKPTPEQSGIITETSLSTTQVNTEPATKTTPAVTSKTTQTETTIQSVSSQSIITSVTSALAGTSEKKTSAVSSDTSVTTEQTVVTSSPTTVITRLLTSQTYVSSRTMKTTTVSTRKTTKTTATKRTTQTTTASTRKTTKTTATKRTTQTTTASTRKTTKTTATKRTTQTTTASTRKTTKTTATKRTTQTTTASTRKTTKTTATMHPGDTTTASTRKTTNTTVTSYTTQTGTATMQTVDPSVTTTICAETTKPVYIPAIVDAIWKETDIRDETFYYYNRYSQNVKRTINETDLVFSGTVIDRTEYELYYVNEYGKVYDPKRVSVVTATINDVYYGETDKSTIKLYYPFSFSEFYQHDRRISDDCEYIFFAGNYNKDFSQDRLIVNFDALKPYDHSDAYIKLTRDCVMPIIDDIVVFNYSYTDERSRELSILKPVDFKYEEPLPQQGVKYFNRSDIAEVISILFENK